MIHAVKGILEKIENGKIYINVNGIIYEVVVGNTGDLESKINEEVYILTKLIVSDDGLTLYGFSTPERLKLFEKLISVNKLGPKSALKILASNSVEEIVSAIVNEDVSRLSKMPGIGSKTAERIIMELKDSLKEFDLTLSEIDKKTIEAIEALVTLGFSKSQATKAVKKAAKNENSLDDIIRKALKYLSNK
ncbi:Holliday junction branch migration protein RuvA [Thermosipho atlanticus]|uniref:Holliday junction branch migration complex subunit RuvA n=1 Tax=Thermosipho atlanticus DSM 15807 TaxID=1123380 RepID=A0A1M5TK51_9BACT|nr:Holliday junction branch migration protein RuvA [Thermosipho atlanticus]SHH51084.1 Holliday junction DNA helicase subunit RuvA [Thermosipho atlanticus DSM 15807]